MNSWERDAIEDLLFGRAGPKLKQPLSTEARGLKRELIRRGWKAMRAAYHPDTGARPIDWEALEELKTWLDKL